METGRGLHDADTTSPGGPDLKDSSRLPPASGEEHEGQRRILLVDDVEVYREMGRVILKRLGHVVTTAANGETAAKLACQQSFDLIFMDLQMPVLDGFGATARIRAHERTTGAHVPIVAMTCPNPGVWEKCLAAGMDGHLSKPVQRVDIIDVINRHRRFDRASCTTPDTEGHGQPAAIRPTDEETAADLVPVFDRGGLLDLLCGDEAMAEKFLELYLNTVGGYLDQLAAALFSANVKQVHILAHTIKGAAINIGALQVSELAHQLETLVREGGLAGAVELFDGLMSSVIRFRREAESGREKPLASRQYDR